jgi:ABC-2 type transport system ATP-binding protein
VPQDAFVSVKNLVKRYGATLAVDDVSFAVAEGEVFGLLGPNGAGKTTTVRILCTLLRPTSGEASVAGMHVDTHAVAIRQQVGLLTEQPGLYDRLTGMDNLLYFADLAGVARDRAMPRIEKYLTRFGLWDRRGDPAGNYSKGMRQKLALVRALVHEPKVIFLDEPTSALDPESALSVRDTVRELSLEGRTVVVCTHNLAEAERLCHRVAIIRRRLLAMGRVADLLHAEASVAIEFEGPGERWTEAARSWPGARSVSARDGLLRVALRSIDEVADLVALLVGKGARVRAVTPERKGLEEAYLDLVRLPSEDANPAE